MLLKSTFFCLLPLYRQEFCVTLIEMLFEKDDFWKR